MSVRRRFRISQARVDRALAVLRSAYSGRLQQRSMTLTATEYKRLLQRIKEPENKSLFKHFHDKLRYHYTRSRKCFEIKVPTNAYEAIRVEIERQINRWVDGFQKEGGDKRIYDAATSFCPGGLTTIQYPSNVGVRDARTPDASFYCERCECDCVFPNLVVEIGWARNDRALAEIAKSYIRSKGITRTVVTLGLHRIYQAEEKSICRRSINDEEVETDVATFSVWRDSDDGKPMQTISDQVFRDKEGSPVASVALELSLKDFICGGILVSPEGAFEDPVLRITSEDLCKRLDKGLVNYRQYRKDNVL